MCYIIPMPEKVGFTTTIPQEVIWAAGYTPVDLNNIFIDRYAPQKFISLAERNGYPRNVCSWIKGIYGLLLKNKSINTIIGVLQGDCSNTKALLETLEKIKGKLNLIPFSYPHYPERLELKTSILKLMDYFKVSLKEVEKTRKQLYIIRKKLKEIDQLTYIDNKVSGFENHFYLVSASDMAGNFKEFNKELDRFIVKAKKRKGFKEKIRIGYLGVPPIYPEIYSYIESLGGRVVYNEIQRQFAMYEEYKDMIDQYLKYTYPYHIDGRINDIKKQIKLREIDALIHYVQSFCHRQIEDLVIRKEIKLPILTIEGDKPFCLDERLKLRIESFMEMLSN